jgi:hypothetical protein
MLALQYASADCRGDLVVNSTQLVSRVSVTKPDEGAVRVTHSGAFPVTHQPQIDPRSQQHAYIRVCVYIYYRS